MVNYNLEKLDKLVEKKVAEEQKAINYIKHCIVMNIMNAIEGKQFDKIKTKVEYSSKINSNDLAKLIHNLEQLFSTSTK
jgi:enoyl-[acyl-carrier-protein] reductase (NADH)